MQKKLKVSGARVHNLNNVSVEMPRNKMVVITGVSGSGKSSLAFDTIYAEGQRRYMESLSAYARQFLDQLDKPDVDVIEGLSPAISIDQKSGSKNPRSTVGTVTEIYDYLRLLFSAVGKPHCPTCKTPIEAMSVQEIVDCVQAYPEGTVITIEAPLVVQRKGEFVDMFESYLKKGFRRVAVNGKMQRLDEEIRLNKRQKHDINLVVDRVQVDEENASRVFQSIETALLEAEGRVWIRSEGGVEDRLFSEHHSCLKCGFSLPELSARLFSFNSPLGACQTCNGLGESKDFDPDALVMDHNKAFLSAFPKLIKPRSVLGLAIKRQWLEMGLDSTQSYQSLTQEQKNILFFGVKDLDYSSYHSANTKLTDQIWDGIIPLLRQQYKYTYSEGRRFYYRSFMNSKHCGACQGHRLNPSAAHVKVADKSLADLCEMPIDSMLDCIQNMVFSEQDLVVIKQVKREIESRLQFLCDVGLSYLSLNRKSGTLSGGEFQRIRLATQIGSALTGVLYVLDEPSIGLHQRDNEKLIATLKTLRDLGNTLLIVEHDDATINAADYVVEIGPQAGVKGGNIVFSGTQKAFQSSTCLTAQYMTGKKSILVPRVRRKAVPGKVLKIKGAAGNNLKNIDVRFPLGQLVCVTGVSGSGKSTLIYEILHKALMRHFHGSKEQPAAFDSLEGLEHVTNIITIDQSPIGRTPRSNPATYVGVFTAIRELFSKTKDARMKGYKPGRFSFNVKGGRCETCQGDGVLTIEMHFLSDVYVTCDVCKGKRYNQDTLDVRFKGYTIADVLSMTVNQACDLFAAIPVIHNKLSMLQSVGLGYITVGQSATTLSGGEAQRIKLSKELSKRHTGNTIYLLDEPTTGLHFEDIQCLLKVINQLVDAGNTVVVIEHNLDVIKTADHIIDLGPDGGKYGGSVVASGTPEQVANSGTSATGKWLKGVLGEKKGGEKKEKKKGS